MLAPAGTAATTAFFGSVELGQPLRVRSYRLPLFPLVVRVLRGRWNRSAASAGVRPRDPMPFVQYKMAFALSSPSRLGACLSIPAGCVPQCSEWVRYSRLSSFSRASAVKKLRRADQFSIHVWMKDSSLKLRGRW